MGNFSGGFQHLVINALICLDYSNHVGIKNIDGVGWVLGVQ